MNKWTKETLASALRLHEQGWSIAKIGRHFNVSRGRASQVLIQAKRPANSLDPFEGLSVRAMNCLRSKDLKNRDEVLAAINNGGIDEIPNLGSVTKIEIRNWLGLPEEIQSHTPTLRVAKIESEKFHDSKELADALLKIANSGQLGNAEKYYLKEAAIHIKAMHSSLIFLEKQQGNHHNNTGGTGKNSRTNPEAKAA